MIRTKIVATIGPATRDPAVLRQLIESGLNVARLNFSHGRHEEHAAVVADLRRIGDEVGRPVAILQDLAGPKIRTGPLATETVDLETGGTIVLTARDVPGDAREIGLTYSGLPGCVTAGDRLLLADGALELRVEDVDGTDIRCTVINGGELRAHKGINLPDGTVDAPILSEKDRRDLTFGLAQGVDYVALSFVRTADDVRQVRRFVAETSAGDAARTPLIAKIEKHEALANIDAILAEVDGLMVARGDLGVEIPVERVPGVQKLLIRRANRAGKPVITATQMLRSMVESPRPTRAEVTDVANAILDGTDAVMLSEETAIGDHPVAAVQMMTAVAADIEAAFPHDEWKWKIGQREGMTYEEAVAHAACNMADDIAATAIVTCTQSGSTTRQVAKYRPRQRLLAMTPDAVTYRRLALVWGAEPLPIEPSDDLEAIEGAALDCALARGHVQEGEPVVLTAGMPFHVRGTTNLIKVATAVG
jgi:pyruvate kinase